MVNVPKHVNKEVLPTIGPWLYAKIGGEFIKVRRKNWAKSYHPNSVDFYDEEDNLHCIKLGELEWFYP